MVTSGLVDEVRWLLEKGYNPGLPSLSAIGYRELIAHLRGEMSLDEAIRLIKRQTRIYVRRQSNWFKLSDPNIHWFLMEVGVLDRIELLVKAWLESQTVE
jgi:tRNA dimethylallyltransferase